MEKKGNSNKRYDKVSSCRIKTKERKKGYSIISITNGKWQTCEIVSQHDPFFFGLVLSDFYSMVHKNVCPQKKNNRPVK